MTFTIRTRGAPGLVLADYECPFHGRFERLVERDDDGDPPDEVPCDIEEPVEGLAVMDMCCLDSPWVPSAVHGKVKIAEVQRGKSDERPPWALNTEALADGMPMHEWRAKQDKLDRDRRIKKNREALK